MVRKGDEVAIVMQKDPIEIESVLDTYKSDLLKISLINEGKKGKKRYYLNAKGIIKVCSLFT